ncbi:MAG: VWA domain-containing protein [Acidobacteriota bacterium]
MKSLKIILITILLFSMISAGQEVKKVESKPMLKFISPEKDAVWLGEKKIEVEVTGIDKKKIQSVEFFLDGKFLKEMQNPPFTINYDFGKSPKNRVLKAILKDFKGVLLRKEIRSYQFDDVQNVNVVEMAIPIAVIDRDGNYVRGLTRDNFILTEEGKPLKISYLNLINNQKRDFHLVLLIDISSSMKDKMEYIKDAAKVFLEDLMRKGDKAIVIFFNHEVIEDTDFTGDINELINSISLAFPFGATSLYDAIAHCINLIKGLSGRNIIIVFSDGEDNNSFIDPYTLMKKAEKSNTEIYSIGKRIYSYSEDKYMTLLKKISKSSGGIPFFFDHVREIKKVYKKIRKDIQAKYLLYFTPEKRGSIKQFRKISIKLKGTKKYKIRTVKGYYY